MVKGTQAVQRKESELNKIMQLLFHRAVMWNNTSYMLIKHMALLGIKHGLLLLLFYEIKKKRLLDFECNLNASKGCNSLWLQQKKGRKKIICKCKNRDCPHLFFFPSSSSFPLSATLSRPPPPSAESHYRNTISNTSAQVFDRLQTNLYSGGKQKAAEIYLECGGEKQASA